MNNKCEINEDIETLFPEEKLEIDSNMGKHRKKRWFIVLVILLLILGIIGIVVYFKTDIFKKKDNKVDEENPVIQEVIIPNYNDFKLDSNELTEFDLYLLKSINKEENVVYSPLSIKYALEMLGEGAKGDSKEQITKVVGEYKATKYTNSKNMSFANAMFVRDTFKDSINDGYIMTLRNKYNAEVIYDPFKKPDNINKWVSDKTFNLINDLIDDVSDTQFVLVNALAIDMEWNKWLQATTESYYDEYTVLYKHETYFDYISVLGESEYASLKFNNKMDAKAVTIGATVNNYDIVNDLGKENIRKTITKEYQEWLDNGVCGDELDEEDKDVDKFVNNFIEELDSNYKDVSTSTDFKFYVDDNIKVFEKELKEYNNLSLEYIGIMPRKVELKDFIANSDTNSINEVINKLLPVTNSSFNEGSIYKLRGIIPLFNYEYEINLIKYLKTMGIVDVFDMAKADLTGLTDEKVVIDSATHKANIEFSNEGIKAAAATQEGGKGASGCYFEHLYEVPVIEIDLTFDQPYLYIIRDKDTKEVWFIGSVYEPSKWEQMFYAGE